MVVSSFLSLFLISFPGAVGGAQDSQQECPARTLPQSYVLDLHGGFASQAEGYLRELREVKVWVQ